MLTIELTCPFCGADHSVEMDYRDFVAWEQGELIQNVAPYLSATEREQLISHICPKCQEDIFGTSAEEEQLPFEDCDGNCTGCPHHSDCYLEDAVDECGFDPYAGCYTEDC